VPKILVVDDEPDLVKLLTFRFEREGWEVITACDGHQGVTAAEEHHPDLIVLDIMMPVLDGMEALEQIRTSRGIHKTPVVMLTAKNSAFDTARARELYVQHYVTKPFDNEKLVSTIKRVLRLT